MKKLGFSLLAASLLVLSACGGSKSGSVTKTCTWDLDGEDTEIVVKAEDDEIETIKMSVSRTYEEWGASKEMVEQSKDAILADFDGIDGLSVDYELGNDDIKMIVDINLDKFDSSDLSALNIPAADFSDRGLDRFLDDMVDEGFTCK